MKTKFSLVMLFLLGGMILSAAPVTVKQATKLETAETFFQALLQQDSAALWQINPPEIKQLLIKNHGSEAKAVEFLKKVIETHVKVNDMKTLQQTFNTPEAKKQLLEFFILQAGGKFSQYDGKWYLQTGDFAQVRIDHTSKAAVVEAFVRAMAEKNADLLWELIPPKERNGVAAAANGEIEAKKIITQTLLEATNDAESAEVLKILNSEEKATFIQYVIPQFEKVLMQIDGKWYLNLDAAFPQK